MEKEICQEIYKLCSKENIKSDFIKDIKEKVENKIKIIEWYEKYSIVIPDNTDMTRNYFKIDGYYGDPVFIYFEDAQKDHDAGTGRSISWSDDGRQPLNEWLYHISFSTGAYIFGDDYPIDLFKEFFQELKNLSPKYTDTTNKCLYWSLEDASKVITEFPVILKKYQEKNKEDFKFRKIKKLEEELTKLKN